MFTAVDHVVIRGSGAQHFFDFCTNVLQLPVAWPPDSLAGMPVTTCGVCAGNINLEMDWDNAGPGAPTGDGPAQLTGIVFQPDSLDHALVELDARAIDHTPPWTPDDPGYGERYLQWLASWTSLDPGTTGFTAVGIPGFLDTGTVAFCEYTPGLYRVHAELAERFESAGGGPLGLLGIEEIRVSTPSPEASAEQWRKLFDPLPPAEPGLWRLERGPAIRLIAGDASRVQGLVLRVRSLDQARAFLREHDLGAGEQDGRLVLEPDSVSSLDVSCC